MKNYFRFIVVFGVALLVTNTVTLAQIPEKYREVSLGFGPRSLSTTPGVISTTFIDDSPSMDSFEGSFDVEDGYDRFGFNLGYNWGKYDGLSHKVFFDIAFGDNGAGLFAYGIGWNFSRELGSKILTINPGVFAGFGNYGFGIGELENNAGFIEINGTQYFEDALDMSLTSQVFVFGPELSADYNFVENARLWLNLAYDIGGSNNRPRIDFVGQESTSSVEVDGVNPRVTYNGELLEELPYDVSGLRLTLGVSYVWNRD